MSRYTVTRLQDPPRVRLQLQGAGLTSYEWSPLDAAHLGGRMMAEAMGLLNEADRLGASPLGMGPIVLWTHGPDGWQPQTITRRDRLNAAMAKVHADGTPYTVTTEIIGDPLDLSQRKHDERWTE